jgi:hypothetical protein
MNKLILNMFQRSLLYIFWIAFVISGGVFGYLYNTGASYGEYQKLFEYRRLHPDFLPNTKAVKLLSAWHENSYADTLWINLVQYIGDNIGNGKFRDFANPTIEKISELHPYFVGPYNLALLLSPILNDERPTYEADKNTSIAALRIGEKWIKNTCNDEKIGFISSQDFGKKLWDNTDMKNPCEDGMLPYYTAYVASEVDEPTQAAKYYKIASMNDDAPEVSKFLWPLMLGKKWDHKEAAEKLLIIGIDGYDEAPYTCRTLWLKILTSLKTTPLSEVVNTLRLWEDTLIEPQDTKNPLASSNTACYPSIVRAMKQIYFAYITDISLWRPDITTGEELVSNGLLSKIPTIKEQDGWWLIREKNGQWRYTKPE